MWRNPTDVLLSIVLLSGAWLGGSGLPLLVALVPLMRISRRMEDSSRGWWRMFGWALLTFAGWNAATVWWIWYATPVGPFAATLASSTLNMIAFMFYHTVSKKAHKPLAYTALVSSWIATEYWYTVGEFSWPWLLLGNGFSHDIWAVQWYEYTGIFGGTLWVLLSNILLFEAIEHRRQVARWVLFAACALLPPAFSLVRYLTFTLPDQGSVEVAMVQPNVDVYDKFAAGTAAQQEENLLALAAEAPADADYILMPETALPGYIDEAAIDRSPGIGKFASLLARKFPRSILITGAQTVRYYPKGRQSATARFRNGNYYDIYNTAIAIDSAGNTALHHKSRLVIGVEKMPLPWLFRWLDFLVIDLGGTVGQLGVDQHRTVFDRRGELTGTAICYEGLYGDYYGDFVRGGAQAMFIISNDGWWGDSPGYRHLFTISRLRAIEHRRAIARCANTGISGFIDASGRVGETLGWEERGVLAGEVRLNSRQTFYTRYGDYIGRIAEYVMLLSVLYYVAYRVRRRNHLVS